MAAAVCSGSTTTTFSTISSLSSSYTATSPVKAPGLICPNSFRPNFACNLALKPCRLKISHSPWKASKPVFRMPIVSCLVDDNSEADPEAGQSNLSNDSESEATIDLKLPRRSLLVQFTCNACGERSQKLINRLAYERGAVFIQCSGCFQHHKLVDNLGLVVEYDFREGNAVESNADQA